MDVKNIQIKLASGRFEFSQHAFKRAVERNITESDIYQAGANIEIIEDYPHDKYSPSCLVLGYARTHYTYKCVILQLRW